MNLRIPVNLKLLSLPLTWLIFLYFLTASAELLNVKFFIFKIKLTNLIGVILFLFSVRNFYVPGKYFRSFLLLMTSILISLGMSSNLVASAGFLVFFVFNFCIYFFLPLMLMRKNPGETFRLYLLSFVVVGSMALAQVIFSFIGVFLPFITQQIGTVARGQAWCYEPSYFALYMTPFIAFINTEYFLLPKRSKRFVALCNLMYLSSTSTGCFFTYIWMSIVLMFVLNKWKAAGRVKLMAKFLGMIAAVFILIGIVFPEGLAMHFKFFIAGFRQHGSFGGRWDGIRYCWDVFLEHPFFGVGLGGVSTYLTRMNLGGEYVYLFERNILDLYQPTNVTLEVMSSLGLFGCLGFVYLFYHVTNDFSRALSIPNSTREEKVKIYAFAVSLIVSIFALQFNQSIMRSYSWVHLAISIGYLNYLMHKYSYSIAEDKSLNFSH